MNVDTNIKPVLTKAALMLPKKHQEFEALVFEGPKRKSQQVVRNQVSNDEEKRRNEFDIKRARHEVLKFAMNNQRAEKNRKKMMIYHLVDLGAKPPKKPYKNYKEFLAERNRLKQIREERRKFHQLGKNQTGLSSVKCRNKSKIEKQQKRRLPVTSIDERYGSVGSKFKQK
ncbi:uncharacterized protein C1orf131 [Glossina fuscipes]|uniref:Uncharacterized protein C1orf131 n=1 Tax=Glossina fuscipes TaxID=7396 RepID=A0A9C6DRL1_9MUSC|nr:uncharacterized protein C1orf131 [Glossina fuscipes]KAI9590542.1 hypothetical protein GQX74_008709 [Glossina fuscipes]